MSGDIQNPIDISNKKIQAAFFNSMSCGLLCVSNIIVNLIFDFEVALKETPFPTSPRYLQAKRQDFTRGESMNQSVGHTHFRHVCKNIRI